MIDKENFEKYLDDVFGSQIIYSEPFNDMICKLIDCFSKECKHQLVVDFCSKYIRIDTILKEPSVDFSLYNYVFENNKDAEEFVQQIVKSGWPKPFE